MPLSGFSLGHMIGGLYGAEAEETLTISNSVKSLTEAKFTVQKKLAKRAFITVENASFRYFYTGTNPTASVGHIARPNSVITIIGTANIKNFKAIRTGSNSKITVTYEF